MELLRFGSMLFGLSLAVISFTLALRGLRLARLVGFRVIRGVAAEAITFTGLLGGGLGALFSLIAGFAPLGATDLRMPAIFGLCLIAVGTGEVWISSRKMRNADADLMLDLREVHRVGCLALGVGILLSVHAGAKMLL